MMQNDYGRILTLENLISVRIDELVRLARQNVKKMLLQSIETNLGTKIDLVTSKVGGEGIRYWFTCPRCQRRVGVLYHDRSDVACRLCVGYRYAKSRYKGMSYS